MAFSSDASMSARGFVPPQNEDERRLMHRIEELCDLAYTRGIPRYTGFLSDREQVLAQAACNRAGFVAPHFWGGYDGAERCVLCLEPPDTWKEEPVAYLRLLAYTGPEKFPTHRDYLGAILGLGLDRACLGDLLQDPEDARVFYAMVLEDKQEFIALELTNAGRYSVKAEACDQLPQHLWRGTEHSMQETTVSSLRVDAVLAAMMHTSRTCAAEYIAAGRVEINHLPVHAAHEPVYTRDIFTVRGIGRFRLMEIGGKSRKDRIFISFFQY